MLNNAERDGTTNLIHKLIGNYKILIKLREQWSRSEELHFLQLLLQNGRRWADISLKLSMITKYKRRTEFALKHKFK